MQTKIPIIIICALWLFSCSNSSESSSATSPASEAVTASSKGCTSSQIAFRIKNATASQYDLRIADTTCNGTTYSGNPGLLNAGQTSGYVCAAATNYKVKNVDGGGATLLCSTPSFTTSANNVYTFTVSSIAGTTLTASVAQDN